MRALLAFLATLSFASFLNADPISEWRDNNTDTQIVDTESSDGVVKIINGHFTISRTGNNTLDAVYLVAVKFGWPTSEIFVENRGTKTLVKLLAKKEKPLSTDRTFGWHVGSVSGGVKLGWTEFFLVVSELQDAQSVATISVKLNETEHSAKAKIDLDFFAAKDGSSKLSGGQVGAETEILVKDGYTYENPIVFLGSEIFFEVEVPNNAFVKNFSIRNQVTGVKTNLSFHYFGVNQRSAVRWLYNSEDGSRGTFLLRMPVEKSALNQPHEILYSSSASGEMKISNVIIIPKTGGCANTMRAVHKNILSKLPPLGE